MKTDIAPGPDAWFPGGFLPMLLAFDKTWVLHILNDFILLGGLTSLASNSVFYL
jgi:hypothetical protein